MHEADFSALQSFVTVDDCEEANAEVDALMQRLLGVGAPGFPSHFIARVRLPDSRTPVACYIHATDCGDMVLTGGACTDNRVLRQLDDAQREQLRRVGGIYRYTVMWMQRVYRGRFAAMFACCGNKAAEKILLRTNATKISDDGLFVYWLEDVPDRRRAQMIAKARSFMPF